MNSVETKINAVMRAMTAPDAETYEAAMAQIRMYLEPGRDVPASDAEYEINRALLEIGAPNHVKGHPYLVTAIAAVIEDPGLIDIITKGLYPLVAQAHGTTKSRAERAMRHAIELAFDRCDVDVLNEYFGNTVSLMKGKPTNSEFIARVANVVRWRLKR